MSLVQKREKSDKYQCIQANWVVLTALGDTGKLQQGRHEQ